MKKLKEFMKNRTARISMMVATLAASLSCVACATGETPTGSEAVKTAFASGFQTMASDALSMIAVIVPIALGVAGVVFLSRKAIGWFKGLAK